MAGPKIVRMGDAEQSVMYEDRGVTKHLVGTADGEQKLDVHINTLNKDSGTGPYHMHADAANVYIVLEGVVEAIIDNKRYMLVKDDVALIPAGVPHAAGSAGLGTATIIEIYAPAGDDFHLVRQPTVIVDVERPEIVDLLKGFGMPSKPEEL